MDSHVRVALGMVAACLGGLLIGSGPALAAAGYPWWLAAAMTTCGVSMSISGTLYAASAAGGGRR